MKQASNLRLKEQIKLSNFKKEKNKKQKPQKLKTENTENHKSKIWFFKNIKLINLLGWSKKKEDQHQEWKRSYH